MVVDAVSERIISKPGLTVGAWTMDLDGEGGTTWSEEYVPGRYLPPARQG